ncbi:hypothetical protein E2C01_073850 [Portunus trituberculatus]|uniref:Uncharacterized protein n=1 Tax=Portunus trituberculatus TaxID=210409 RepID=A0A5B7ICR5_PORTR|nr:hypothetical protein [Portunus trituberculatus]
MEVHLVLVEGKTKNENAEEEELVIPLLQAKRSAVLSRLAKLQQGDGGKEGEGKKEEETTQENQEDSKPLTLEEKAEHALLEGKLLFVWAVKGRNCCSLCFLCDSILKLYKLINLFSCGHRNVGFSGLFLPLH